jgi:hypothetical protein
MVCTDQLKALGERIVQAARLAVQLHLNHETDSTGKTDLPATPPGEIVGLSDERVRSLLRQAIGAVTDDSLPGERRRAG